jgi:hypothetical protein
MKNRLMVLSIITAMFLTGAFINYFGFILRDGPKYATVIWTIASGAILILQIIQVVLLFKFKEPRRSSDRPAK